MELDPQMLGHLQDLEAQAKRRSEPAISFFLRPEEQDSASFSFPRSHYFFYGGYDEAERKAMIFLPEYMECPDFLASEEREPHLHCLKIEAKGKRYAESLTHRDYLGALMALGIKRETLGDILLGEGEAYVYLLGVAKIEALALEEVKHTKVSVKEVGLHECPYTPKITEKRGTVASLRLDALIAEGFSLSRSQAVALIEEGLVRVGQSPIKKPDYAPKEGERIAVKGKGKMAYLENLGETKKGKIAVKIGLYE